MGTRQTTPAKWSKLALFLCAFAVLTAGGRWVAAADSVKTGPAARAILDELAKDVSTKLIAADAVRRAEAALSRAAAMREGGDDAHASLADGVALEWAELARDSVHAAEVEVFAASAAGRADDAGAAAFYERALLEEAVAHRGRVHAQLDATGRTDGGSR